MLKNALTLKEISTLQYLYFSAMDSSNTLAQDGEGHMTNGIISTSSQYKKF